MVGPMNPRRLLLASVAFLTATACLAETPEAKVGFLLERKTITTKTGVIGIAAGTRVLVVGRHGDTVIIKANDQEFEVPADQITTDPQTATVLSQREQHQQEILEKEAAEREIRYKESLIARQQEEESAARARKPDGTAVERQLQEIHKKRELLKIDLDNVQSEQKDLPPPNGSSRIHQNHYPYRATVVRTSPNAFKLQEKRKAIEHELMELDQQERRLRLESH
jgi:hypothetical protein